MQLRNSLNELFEHMMWADIVVWKAVLTFPKAEKDPKLHELFHHIHLTHHAFGGLWIGEKFEYRKPENFKNLTEILEWGREGYDKFMTYLASNPDLDLTKDVTVPWAKMFEQKLGKTIGPTTLGETMLQLTLHTTYHRGQINARLRSLGAEPPMVDFIAWLWMGRPKEEWPKDKG